MLVLIIFHLIEKRDGKIIEGSEQIVSIDTVRVQYSTSTGALEYDFLPIKDLQQIPVLSSNSSPKNHRHNCEDTYSSRQVPKWPVNRVSLEVEYLIVYEYAKLLFLDNHIHIGIELR